MTVTLFLLFAALPGLAQDLPDPGRRLTPEELKANPEHPPRKPPAEAAERTKRDEREERACRNARIQYQLACGAPGSRREYGRDCNEAYALYRQSCP